MEVATRKFFIEQNVQFEEDLLYDAPPSKAQEGISTLPPIFYDDDLLHVSVLDEEDQYHNDPIIEDEPHEVQDPDPTTIPNQRPKPRWSQNIIVTAGDVVGNPEYRRRTRS